MGIGGKQMKHLPVDKSLNLKFYSHSVPHIGWKLAFYSHSVSHVVWNVAFYKFLCLTLFEMLHFTVILYLTLFEILHFTIFLYLTLFEMLHFKSLSVSRCTQCLCDFTVKYCTHSHLLVYSSLLYFKFWSYCKVFYTRQISMPYTYIWHIT